jgi:ATP-binding cassette subfamily F protein uup
LAGADRRAVEKELAAVERRLEKATHGIRTAKEQLDAVDPSDYVMLGAKQTAIAALEAEAHALEEQWLALGAQLEG